MIVTRDGEKLYPSAFVYHTARILTELDKIVVNHGGRVKPNHKTLIKNRGLHNAVQDLTQKIEYAKENTLIAEDRKRAYLAKLEKELEDLEQIPNEWIEVSHTTWIEFVLEDYHYYYSVDDNPFFPWHYGKTPVKNNRYSKDACLEEAEKEWLYDCFFGFRCSTADHVEAANMIFNMLMNAKPSIIRRDGTRQRVPNVYNSGYHYETVYKPERFAEIDF